MYADVLCVKFVWREMGRGGLATAAFMIYAYDIFSPRDGLSHGMTFGNNCGVILYPFKWKYKY